MITILQEADEVLYRAALSVEKRCYKVELAGGEVHDLSNEYTKTEIINMMADKGRELDKHYKLDFYREAEPLSHATFLADRILRGISKHGDNMRLFLSPSDKSNFRHAKAVTPGPNGPGYKAGRADKPLLYEGVRAHLIERYGAEETHGYEADDALGLYQTRNTIASHIDKDINMIVGEHLNWVSGVRYSCKDPGHLEVNNKNKVVGGGLKFFYLQLLTGDRTDNIPGIGRCGPKTGYNLLSEASEEQEMIDIVVGQYQEKFPETWRERLLEIADLIWICRESGVYGSIYLGDKLG